MPRIVKAPDVRRSELIANAHQLFHTKDFERTSVNDIVEQVGAQKAPFSITSTRKQPLSTFLVPLMAQYPLLMKKPLLPGLPSR